MRRVSTAGSGAPATGHRSRGCHGRGGCLRDAGREPPYEPDGGDDEQRDEEEQEEDMQWPEPPAVVPVVGAVLEEEVVAGLGVRWRLSVVHLICSSVAMQALSGEVKRRNL